MEENTAFLCSDDIELLSPLPRNLALVQGPRGVEVVRRRVLAAAAVPLFSTVSRLLLVEARERSGVCVHLKGKLAKYKYSQTGGKMRSMEVKKKAKKKNAR